MLRKNDLALLDPPAKRAKSPDVRHLSVADLHDLAERLDGSPIPNLTMTESEFVAWCPEGLRAEWVDGKVILMSPSNVDHDDLTIWFIRLLGDYVESHELGAIYQNLFVRLAPQRRRRVPDLMFIAADRLHLLKETYLDGPPDLLIEIVSPDSQSRDRRDKYAEYEKAGVREYWIVDPLSKSVEAMRLDRKKFHRIDEGAGVIASTVLRGFRIKTEHLWQKPLPKVAGTLKWMARR